MLAVLSIPLAACSKHGTGEQTAITLSGLTLPAASYALTLQTPKDVDVMDVALGAAAGIDVQPNASVTRSNGAPALLTNVGSGGINLRPGTLTGQASSASTVTVFPGAHLIGGISAASATVLPGAVVDGPVNQSAVLTPPQETKFTIEFPAAPNAADVSVKPKGTADILPGRYGNISVAPNAKLILHSGAYYAEDLSFAANSSCELRQKTGPTQVFVRHIDKLDGATSFPSAYHGFILVQIDPGTISISAPFHGVLLAPTGSLELKEAGAAHRGSFFASSIVVGPKAQVVYEPPNPLVPLFAPPGKQLQNCADAIRPPDDSTGAARQNAFQTEIARYCSMPGSDDCNASLVGRANVDFFLLAGAIMGATITPAQYLAVVRDRERKLKAALGDPTLALALCQGADGDGDWIPDAVDKCPGTPDLTQTDPAGCTDPTLPLAPSVESVKQVFAASGVLSQAACSGAAMLPKIPSGAFYRTDNPVLGTFILSSRVMNQPAGCPLWYFFDIEEYQPGGNQVLARYMVAFKDTEESTALAGLAMPVPPGFIQFNAFASDGGARGLLGAAGPVSGIRFRVRVMNGGGMRSEWSDWKFTTNEQCLALGFKCVE